MATAASCRDQCSVATVCNTATYLESMFSSMTCFSLKKGENYSGEIQDFVVTQFFKAVEAEAWRRESTRAETAEAFSR